MQEYLELLEKFQIPPNFWCSQEYSEKAHLILRKWGWYLIIDPSWGPMLPPVHKDKGLFLNSDPMLNNLGKIWSDFPHYKFPRGTSKFLDHEFIYRPSDFCNMEGGMWAVFRKNSRKFPKRLQKEWLYRGVDTYKCQFGDRKFEENLSNLMILWLDSLKGAELQDDTVLMKYVNHGENRKILYDDDGIIYGLNIWDENYKYINFRFSICVREDFASEFMRLLFYTDPEILKSGKLVNDGGSLGSQKLYDFKMKLNPVKIREVKSWYK